MHVVKPVVESPSADIKEQKQEIDDSTRNSEEVTNKTPPKDSTSDELDDKGIEIIDREIQVAKKIDINIEGLNMVNKEFDHLMDLIVDSLPKEQVESLKENTIVPEISKEDQVPYINFIFEG